MQVGCPRCHNLFDIPADPLPPTAVCPACDNDFDVAQAQGASPYTVSYHESGEPATAPPSTWSASRAPTPADIPGYEILHELGRGGMGVVYKARQLKANRIVALKMILTGGHGHDDSISRFITEAEAIARLQHPNIVQIYEVGEHNGLPYFSLEYCPGGNLSRRIKGKSLKPRLAARLVEQLAYAIHAAHEQHVIHRDLKPANILLQEDEEVPLSRCEPKITDFGLAKKLDESEGQTQTGIVMGTPEYMAPEQASGQSKHVSAATDVYALGALLYRLLTGRPPFKAASNLDTLMQVMSEQPVPPRKRRSGIPHDLNTICLNCLEKEPEKRYVSAQRLGDDLRCFLDHRPISIRPVGRLGRLLLFIRREPVLVGLLLLIALASIVTVGSAVATHFRLVGWNKSLVDRISPTNNMENNPLIKKLLANAIPKQQEPNKHILVQNNEWRYFCVTFDPKGKWLAAGGEDGLVRLWDVKSRKLVYPFMAHNDKVRSIAINADATLLASAGDSRTIKVWDLKTRRLLHTLTGHRRRIFAVAFHPEKNLLASAGDDETVKIWNAETGKTLHDWHQHGDAVYALAFHPGGHQLASASHDGAIVLWDTATGKHNALKPKHPAPVFSLAYQSDGKMLVSAGGRACLRLWQPATGQPIKEVRWPGRTNTVTFRSVAFRPGNPHLLAVYQHDWLLWDLHKQARIPTRTALAGPDARPAFRPQRAVALAIHPEGDAVALAGWDGSVRLQPFPAAAVERPPWQQ